MPEERLQYTIAVADRFSDTLKTFEGAFGRAGKSLGNFRQATAAVGPAARQSLTQANQAWTAYTQNVLRNLGESQRSLRVLQGATSGAGAAFQEAGNQLRLIGETARATTGLFAGLGGAARPAGAAIATAATTGVVALRQLQSVSRQVNATLRINLGALAGTLAEEFRTLGGAAVRAGQFGARGLGLLAGPLRLLLSLLGLVSGGVLGLAGKLLGPLQGAFQRILSLMQLAAGAGATGLAAGLGMIAKRGLETNLSLGRVRSALEIMLGSGKAASAVLSQLQQDAANTTFSFGELAERTKRLLAFGFDPAQARRAILATGNAAFAMAGEDGASALQDRLTLALGQIKAKGMVGGEEAMQLTEAGVNVRKALNIPVGIDIADAKLTAEQAIPRLLAALEKQFGGVMAREMESIQGRVSNLGDAFDRLSSRVTRGFGEGVRVALGRVLRFLEQLETTAGGQRLLANLARGFDALGATAARLAEFLPGIVFWLNSLFDGNRAAQFTSNVVAAFQGLAQVAAPVIQGLTRAAGNFFNTLLAIGQNQGIMAALAVPFRSLASVLEYVSLQGGRFVAWLQEVLKAEGVRLFLANVAALLATVAEHVLRLSGIDLGKLLDPRNVIKLFDELGARVANTINMVFGLGRVFQEIGRIIKSSIEDTGDRLKDFVEDATRLFKRLFLSVELTIHTVAANMLRALLSIAEGFNKLEVNLGGYKFRPIQIDTSGMQDALRGSGGAMARSAFGLFGQDMEEGGLQRRRRERDARKRREDPFRDQPFDRRLQEAFSGKGRDTSAQDAFWADFNRNRQEVFRGIGGFPETPAPGAFPAAPQLFQPTPGGGSVSIVRDRPAIPAFPTFPPLRGQTVPAAATLPLAGTMDALKAQIEFIRQRVERFPNWADMIKRQELLPALKGLAERLLVPQPAEKPEGIWERWAERERVVREAEQIERAGIPGLPVRPGQPAGRVPAGQGQGFLPVPAVPAGAGPGLTLNFAPTFNISAGDAERIARQAADLAYQTVKRQIEAVFTGQSFR